MWRHRFWSDQTKKVMLRPATRVQYVFARRCSIKRKEILNLDERIQKNEEPFDIDDKQKEIIHGLARNHVRKSMAHYLQRKATTSYSGCIWSVSTLVNGSAKHIASICETSTTEDIIDAYYFMPALPIRRNLREP